MPKTDAQRRAQKKYAESHPEVLQAARQRYEENRPKRNLAAYMREWRARKKQESQQRDQPEG